MCERASLEIFRIFTFKTAISFNILLVLQIFCRYKWHACRLTCTDKFPNVPTKLRKRIIGGGGAIAPCPPPPLATLVFCSSKWFMWDFQEVKGSISHFQHHEIGYASSDDEIMYKCRLLTRFELQTKNQLDYRSQPAYKHECMHSIPPIRPSEHWTFGMHVRGFWTVEIYRLFSSKLEWSNVILGN